MDDQNSQPTQQDETNVSSASETPNEVVPSTPEQPKPKKNLNVPLATAVLLVIVAVIGLGAYLYINSIKTPASTAVVKNDIPIIRYGVIEGPINTFYPSNSTGDEEDEVNEQIFEGLVHYEDQTRIVPLLATSWKNPNNTTWDFTLKPNVKFHTGHTMTADDVKYSLTQFKDSEYGQLYGTTIKSVEVTGPLQVRIITDGPDPVLLNRLAYLFIVDSKSGKQNDVANGTGPYQLKPGTVPTDKVLDLVAFDNYHGGHIYTRALRFTMYDSNEAVAADMKAGKLDLGERGNSPAVIAELTGLGFKTYKSAALSVRFLGINTLLPGSPLQKLKVRQALSLAINRDQLITNTGRDGKPASQIVTQQVPGYDSAIVADKQDTTKAKQLLAEAGYPNGLTLTLTYFAPAQYMADELKTQLAASGITLAFDKVTTVPDIVAKTAGGKSQFFYSGQSTTLLDASDVMTGSFLDAKNYKSAAFEKFMSEAAVTLDQTKRLGLLKQATDTLMADKAWTPLFEEFDTWPVKSTFVMKRDRASNNLGTYFKNIYDNGETR